MTEKRKRRRKNRINAMLISVAVLSGIAAVILSGKVGISVIEKNASNEEYGNISRQYFEEVSKVMPSPEEEKEIPEKDEIETYAGEETNADLPTEQIHFPYIIDFDTLKNINPDIAAWITLPGSEINYPVVYNGDNSYYLTHTFENKVSHTGAIFIDGACMPDFSTASTIIYGHNISGKTGTMFGTLVKYKEQSFMDDNPYLWLATPERNYRLDVFAAMPTRAVSEPYKIDFTDNEDIRSWLDYLHENSVAGTDVETDVNDRFIILSTCSYEFYNGRTIVAAKLVPCVD